MATKAVQATPVVFGAQTQLKAKDFFFKVLTGSAQGILIGVLPSAVMKYVLKYTGLIQTGFGQDLSAVLNLFTILIPFLIGMCIALQFKMKALDAAVVSIAVMAASGSIKWLASGTNPMTHKPAAPLYIAAGAGDVINAMIVSAIGVLAVWLAAKYLNGFGAAAIVLEPIVIGAVVALIGLAIAPYVAQVTVAIGNVVADFTKLAPIPMSILIAMAFSIIIVTPVSTVGIALAISLAGLGSGAAGIGVVATTVVLLINSWRVNKKGVTVAIFLGAMKGMMPSVFKKPIMLLSFMATAAISAIPVALFNVQGTPTTAGFGWIGMVSPIQSMVVDHAERTFISNITNPMIGLLVWFVIPILAGLLVNWVSIKWLKMYTAEDFKQDM